MRTYANSAEQENSRECLALLLRSGASLNQYQYQGIPLTTPLHVIANHTSSINSNKYLKSLVTIFSLGGVQRDIHNADRKTAEERATWMSPVFEKAEQDSTKMNSDFKDNDAKLEWYLLSPTKRAAFKILSYRRRYNEGNHWDKLPPEIQLHIRKLVFGHSLSSYNFPTHQESERHPLW